jgi:hypothetical protein
MYSEADRVVDQQGSRRGRNETEREEANDTNCGNDMKSLIKQ